MNKEKVLEIVNDVINERITQLIDEMSTNEFIEMVSDMVEDQTGIKLETEEDQEEIKEVIGSRVIPLLHKMTEYIVGVDIPIK